MDLILLPEVLNQYLSGALFSGLAGGFLIYAMSKRKSLGIWAQILGFIPALNIFVIVYALSLPDKVLIEKLDEITSQLYQMRTANKPVSGRE